ncbi:lytic transglycosylase domain-containing protein [Crenobacter cavernae]|uniref:Peptidoglycan N-acetylmuramoylhydrolase n=1 Tax=Crenobacter cavernae TaxID=2290923 RepID=A0A345Y8W5_9NEIS|nr:lytic transglycosylase domain-containing protein [Crenobacter cavernae]AXK40367.1 peptidoglycan N-acetylmuramoylhydrolase [Crenobacter cavernae]
MKFFDSGRLTAAVLLGLASLAHAAPADDLVAARDAFKRKDDAALAAYASSMGNDALAVYPRYWQAWRALDDEDDEGVARFLNGEPAGALTERVRNEWLKSLGKRDQWARFASEWALLPEAGRDEESSCYGELILLRQGRAPGNFDRFLESRSVPEGCNRLIYEAGNRKVLSQNWLVQRYRLLLAGNFVTAARELATSTGLPVAAGSANLETDAGKEATVASLIAKARQNPDAAASELSGVEAALGEARAGFVWGQLALAAAKKLNMAVALQGFDKSDIRQLTSEQWEWWARAALRQGDWVRLERIVRGMPTELANKPGWLYWRGRALKAQGRTTEARPLFVQASRNNNYYALLSLEELGNVLDAPHDTRRPSQADVDQVAGEPAIRRSLLLVDVASSQARAEIREDAKREWRWAMRDKSDNELLASAELARRTGFYDMAIYSAERTQGSHDYSLRYLSPYRDVTQRYARQFDVDEAWIYGLIRQESRFVNVARSGVGASGLMQLMPATARWAANKVGLASFSVNDIDTNIQLGTWYLRHVLDDLGQPVLATAAYNAGPGRARAWQAGVPLEGAVYAETIPFNETRDYVQKVMANAAYYARDFGHAGLSLKTRMGTIAAR